MLTESMLRLVHIVPSGAEGTLKILGLHAALVLTITIITGNQLFHTCIRRCTFKEVESFLIRMLGQYIYVYTLSSLSTHLPELHLGLWWRYGTLAEMISEIMYVMGLQSANSIIVHGRGF